MKKSIIVTLLISTISTSIFATSDSKINQDQSEVTKETVNQLSDSLFLKTTLTIQNSNLTKISQEEIDHLRSLLIDLKRRAYQLNPDAVESQELEVMIKKMVSDAMRIGGYITDDKNDPTVQINYSSIVHSLVTLGSITGFLFFYPLYKEASKHTAHVRRGFELRKSKGEFISPKILEDVLSYQDKLTWNRQQFVLLSLLAPVLEILAKSIALNLDQTSYAEYMPWNVLGRAATYVSDQSSNVMTSLDPSDESEFEEASLSHVYVYCKHGNDQAWSLDQIHKTHSYTTIPGRWLKDQNGTYRFATLETYSNLLVKCIVTLFSKNFDLANPIETDHIQIGAGSSSFMNVYPIFYIQKQH